MNINILLLENTNNLMFYIQWLSNTLQHCFLKMKLIFLIEWQTIN